MKYTLKSFLRIWVLGIFLVFIVYAQQPSTKNILVFNKHYIGKVLSDTDTVIIQSPPESDSLHSKRTIKPGKVIGFAVIGFLSGLFLGAETFQGEISGAAFHLKPAYIGAAIGADLGVVVSLLEPQKSESKKK